MIRAMSYGARRGSRDCIARLGNKGEDIFVYWSAQTTVDGLFPVRKRVESKLGPTRKQDRRLHDRGDDICASQRGSWDGDIAGRTPRCRQGRRPSRVDERPARLSRCWATSWAPPNTGHTIGPNWPDRDKGGRPRQTYRNARAAIMALGVTCDMTTSTAAN